MMILMGMGVVGSKAKVSGVSRFVAGSAIFGALTYALEISGLSHFLPFPILTYLLFDPAEIFVALAYLSMGLKASIFTTFILVLGLSINIDYFSLLILTHTGIPFFGPFMKGLAIVSTILGLHAFLKYTKKQKISPVILALSGFIRALAMTPPNILFLTYILPRLPFANQIVDWYTSTMGYALGISIILSFTALYNFLHSFFTLVPASIVFDKIYPYLKRKTLV
ncbi:MAG: hypothetical protein QXO94_04975 [Candidatus Bathyarchaeia archaeon]